MNLALSIRQPWASLILLAGKNIENRTWKTKVRGRILIHAAKGMTTREYRDAMDYVYAYGLCRIGHSLDSFKPGNLPRGGIIGSVNLVDCVYQSDSPWFQGPYGFVLQDPKPLEFIPFTGERRFFDVPGVQP